MSQPHYCLQDAEGRLVLVRGQVPHQPQMPAEDSEVGKIGNDPDRGDLLQIDAACPHCHHITKYRNIFKGGTGMSFTGGDGYRIACRNCNQRFDIEL